MHFYNNSYRFRYYNNVMKISIITVCYNSEKTIRDTIVSVLSQNYSDFEYLIIDGKSKDKTIDIINEFKDPRIVLISEKDNGLYDAMNKGIRNATGDIIGIINSDDILYDNNVFSTIVKNFDSETDIIYANVLYMNDDLSKIMRNYISGEKNSDYWCPAHPSMYIKKDIYETIGTYNTSYSICADYDFMVRCNVNKVRYKYIDEYFVKMRYGGVSNGIKGYVINFCECYKVLKSNKIKYPFLKTIKRTFHTIKQIIKK